MYVKNASATGAFISMVAGMGSWITMEFGPQWGWMNELPIATFIPALGISILGYYAGSFFKIVFFESGIKTNMN